ncbi:hypothetical protein IJ765_04010, partial [Candidatus Saccharibacteria bacterium]|nr:hypothetical protein [Candidatus Saccharibacteria bacterium]
TQNSRFAPVPVKGAEELLITQDDTTTTETQTDNITVYYGYYANSALPSGTYQNTVLYTAYAEATDQEGGIATYTPDGFNYKDGGEITFTTSLYTDRTVSASDVSVTIGDKTCDNIVVSKVGGGNDSVTITCDAPAQDRPGDYPIAIDIDRFAHHSRTSVFYDTDGITVGDTTYKTMQDMKRVVSVGGTEKSLCQAWAPTPAAFTGETVSLDEVGEDEERPYSMDTTNNLAKFINQNVPETTLRDVRDNKWYLIRKLADGNCWMVQNLDLDLSTEVALTSETSDINSTSSWTPSEDTQTLDNFTGWDRFSLVEGSLDPGEVYSPLGESTWQTSGALSEATGNYYSFKTVTAGATLGVGDYYIDSICSRGWKIPVRESSPGYRYLFDEYGLKYRNNWNSTPVDGEEITLNAIIRSPFSMNSFAGRINGGTAILGLSSAIQAWINSENNIIAILDVNYTINIVAALTSGYQVGLGPTVRCVSQ